MFPKLGDFYFVYQATDVKFGIELNGGVWAPIHPEDNVISTYVIRPQLLRQCGGFPVHLYCMFRTRPDRENQNQYAQIQLGKR